MTMPTTSAAVPSNAHSGVDDFMQGYYLAPNPGGIPTFLREVASTPLLRGLPVPGLVTRLLGRDDELTLDAWHHQDTFVISFLGEVFARAPAVIVPSLDAGPFLDEGRKRTLWMAAWRGGVAVDELRRRASATSRAATRYVERLAQLTPAPLLDLPLHGPVVLDMWWSGFFATGERNFVAAIIHALELLTSEDPRQSAIGQAAMWSLTANAKRHRPVADEMQYAVDQLVDADQLTLGAVIRECLQTALQRAAAAA